MADVENMTADVVTVKAALPLVIIAKASFAVLPPMSKVMTPRWSAPIAKVPVKD